MTYQLYDAEGYVGDLATTTGLQEMQEFVEEQPGARNVKGFLEKGAALVTDELIEELQGLSLEGASAEVRSSRSTLQQLVLLCDTVAIVSDGLNEER